MPPKKTAVTTPKKRASSVVAKTPTKRKGKATAASPKTPPRKRASPTTTASPKTPPRKPRAAVDEGVVKPPVKPRRTKVVSKVEIEKNVPIATPDTPPPPHSSSPDVILTPSSIRGCQNLHLVIDLDATFVSTHLDMTSYNEFCKTLVRAETAGFSKSAIEDVRSRVRLFKLGTHSAWTLLRPGTVEFLDFATRFFRKVSVWTAGRRDYADVIVDILFEPPLTRPSIVFSWDECAKGSIDVDPDIDCDDATLSKVNKHVSTNVSASPSNEVYIELHTRTHIPAKLVCPAGHGSHSTCGENPAPVQP